MKEIITIQHTQSIHHTNGMVGSWTDWDLTEQGIRQAHNIGAHLAEALSQRPDGTDCVMYTSDLLRASHTAQIVAQYLSVTPIPEPALRERNLGKCVGQSVQWMRAHMEFQERTIDDRMFSDAESRRDEWERLEPFFQRILDSSDARIILVSHGDLLSVFNAMWLGLPVETLDKCDLWGMAGGVSTLLELPDGKRRIRHLSDMSFVKE